MTQCPKNGLTPIFVFIIQNQMSEKKFKKKFFKVLKSENGEKTFLHISIK